MALQLRRKTQKTIARSAPRFCCAMLILLAAAAAFGQVNQRSDERFKADILVVVAHPDDESAIFSYLAKATLDERKRVAVVFTNRGGGGISETGSERSAALGMVREIEARRALASFGINNVWFFDGHDTLSQNPVLSLANWDHPRILSQVVRAIRLTRPEIVLTWMPAVVGDHGDHQAAGVVATEAFDMAGDPAVFPSQVAARRTDYEPLLEGLRPWQAKKLYYFTGSTWLDLKGKAAEYSNQEISPSRKASYERLAAEEASFYLSQDDPSNPLTDVLKSGDLAKYLRDAKAELGRDIFPNPVQLLLAKNYVTTRPNAGVFDGVTGAPISFERAGAVIAKQTGLSLELGDAWTFYKTFWQTHNLKILTDNIEPRIQITAGDSLQIPLIIKNVSSDKQNVELKLKTKLTDGWTELPHASAFSVEAGESFPLRISIATPKTPSENWLEITYALEIKGKEISSTSLKARTLRRTIPQ